ncbi:hypothetical protein GA0115260_1067418, partial [Streptomyces sp. MnatMP-M27]
MRARRPSKGVGPGGGVLGRWFGFGEFAEPDGLDDRPAVGPGRRRALGVPLSGPA